MCLRSNFRIYRSSSRLIQTGQEHRLYDVKKLTSYSSVPQITLCNLISMNSKITAKQSPWPLIRHEVVKSDVVYKWWYFNFNSILYSLLSFVVCLITGIRVMIKSHRWLLVNISACLLLIVITVNDNSILRSKTARPIREQKIAIICGNEEKLVKPGDMNARSRWANMRSLL